MAESDAVSRPAIVTVDDDPSVSRAVARDLRRQYGEDHRIVRGESGEQALEALRELKLRGEQVAVILADYRMPQMNGIEFLEQAMDIFPAARRVLLTAYADTDAAIQAINLVDVDHYLLKPWDPPEEKLYPVVDELLDDWRSSDHVPVPETKVIGHRWSARSFEVRDFLARNRVPYRWYASTEAEGERLLAAAEVQGEDCIPVVVTPEGEVLRSPSDAELAARVGLSVDPAEEFYDVVVVGGGPAGLGAAVYAASEGLRTVLVERTRDRRAGRPELAHRELPRLPRRHLRVAARRARPPAGGEVRRRGGQRPRRQLRRGARGRPRRPVRRRRHHRRAHRDPGHRRRLPAARGARRRGPDRPRRVLRRRADRGDELRRARTCTSSAAPTPRGRPRCTSRSGRRSVTMLVRGASLRTSMSSYLIEQIEAHAQHRACAPAPASSRRTAPTTSRG